MKATPLKQRSERKQAAGASAHARLRAGPGGGQVQGTGPGGGQVHDTGPSGGQVHDTGPGGGQVHSAGPVEGQVQSARPGSGQVQGACGRPFSMWLQSCLGVETQRARDHV